MQNSVNFGDFMSFRTGKENISSSASGLFSMENGAVQTFGSESFESNYRSSSNLVPLYPLTNGTNSIRSRPSFLDNLNIPKASSGTNLQSDEFERNSLKSNSLKPKKMDFLGSYPFHKPSLDAESLRPFSKDDSLNSSHAFEPSIVSVSDGMASDQLKLSLKENGMEWKHEFLPKQNEDFSALEQVPLCYFFFPSCIFHILCSVISLENSMAVYVLLVSLLLHDSFLGTKENTT